ncbi:MAG: hypothetical protein JXB48_09360 [Candidatus Latescibacteria bacterium]|nr:hypothetical protein [Candidatus Latescibacterota bacterium]
MHLIRKKTADLKFVLGMVIAAIIIAAGCSSPTDSDDNNDNGTDETALATHQVDSYGGTLEADEIQVNIPAGAFSQAAVLSITENKNVAPVDNQVTKQYTISGIPRDFSKDLQIKIKYSGELSETSLMIISWETTNAANDSSYTLYEIVEAEDEDGFLTAAIPASLNFDMVSKRAVDLSNVIIKVFGVSRYIIIYNGNRFHLIFPAEYLLFAQSLSDALDEAYNDILSYGFQYKLATSKKAELRNIVVGAKIIDEEDLPYMPIAPILQDAKDSVPPQIIYRGNALSYIFDSEDRFDIHTAFFRLVQKHYGITQYNSFFFNYAAEGWLRKRFSKVQPYIPAGYTKAPYTILKGITPDLSVLGREEYGEAVSPFFEYLDRRTDMNKNLSVLYQNVHNGKYFIDAVTDLIGEDERSWWPDFLAEFLTGNIYELDTSGIIADTNLAGTFTATQSDTTRTFSQDYTSPFQARLYRVSISENLKEELDYVRFSMAADDVDDAYLKVMVFGKKNGKLVVIGCETDLGVSDIDYHTDDNTFYALAINCAAIMPYYDSARNVSLTVDAVNKDVPVMGDLNTLSFSTSVYGTFLYKKTNFEDTIQQYDLAPLADPWIVDGTLDGTTFTASTTMSDASKTIMVTVAFDETFERITSYSFTGTFSSDSGESYTETMSVAGGDIPYTTTYLGWRIYKLNGTDVCNAISSFDYHSESERTVLDTVSRTSRDMQSFTCGEKSKIEIQIKTKE